MKNFLSVALSVAFLFLVSKNSTGQSIKNLEENHGFKKYKLDSKFVMGYGVKHKDEDGADKIVIDYAREFIGDIPVKSIELYYVKDTLAKIVVQFLPDYYLKLNEACTNSFGPPTKNFSNNASRQTDSTIAVNYYEDSYVWNAKKFNLEYNYTYPKSGTSAYGNKNLNLTYVLNDYNQRIKRMKQVGTSARNF